MVGQVASRFTAELPRALHRSSRSYRSCQCLIESYRRAYTTNENGTPVFRHVVLARRSPRTRRAPRSGRTCLPPSQRRSRSAAARPRAAAPRRTARPPPITNTCAAPSSRSSASSSEPACSAPSAFQARIARDHDVPAAREAGGSGSGSESHVRLPMTTGWPIVSARKRSHVLRVSATEAPPSRPITPSRATAATSETFTRRSGARIARVVLVADDLEVLERVLEDRARAARAGASEGYGNGWRESCVSTCSRWLS